jgi:hypothetical protein
MTALREPSTTPAPSTGRLRSLALPVVSLGFAAAAALLIWRGANEASELAWLVGRVEVASVLLVAFGMGVRSERVVAFATGPALIGLAIGTSGSSQIAWGRALIVGCLWYLATEAALTSIEWSGELQVSAGALQRRLADVSTVVLVGSSVAVLGVVAAGWAPDRSVTARVIVLAAVIGALVVGVRHLAATQPSADSEAPEN